jgi:hypothetical protein
MRVQCFADREQTPDGQAELSGAVFAALLPYFPAGGRRFCPQNLAMAGDDAREMQFTLEFYDLPPDNEQGLALPPMQSLDLRLGGDEIQEQGA